MLELRALRKSYGAHDAVRSVDLAIKPGEFFSLLGPSGCGKTTLLRMLGGFEKPTSGEIWLDGARMDQLPAHERQFNLVFQRYALFPHLTVKENVAFGLRMKKVRGAELEKRVSDALALVQMNEYATRGIGTLSGGQQQRVALARAVVNKPRVLLLDEPLSALDLKLRQQMQVELLSLQRKLGHTFIFVTHDQEEALTLSDRIAVMNQGIVEQVGTPQEIYEYPRTAFVARFIGQMNFIDAEVKETRPDALVVQGAPRRPIIIKPSRDGSRALPDVAMGASIQVMIRPEKLKILKSAPGPEQNVIEGTLKEVLYQGGLTQLFVQPKEPNLPTLIVTQPNAAASARKPFAIGDKAYIAWAPEDCLFAPAGSVAQKPAAVAATESELQPALPFAVREGV